MTELIVPQEIECFDIGRPMHRVPDEWLLAKLGDELVSYCGLDWVACVIKANGEGAFIPAAPLSTRVTNARKHWLRRLVIGLNDRSGHHGVWVAAWCLNNCWQALWFDRDGDLKLTMGDQQPWVRTRNEPIDAHIEHGDEAIREVMEVERHALGVKPEQQIKAAQGQRLPT